MRYVATPASDPECQWYDHANCRKEFDIRNVNLSTGPNNGVEDSEVNPEDLDNDKYMSDDERDEDADGLTNYAEFLAYMQPAYWTGCYTKEKPYLVTYAGTDPTKPDSDGDGILDGADDQDHDDIPNLMEQSRFKASGHYDSKGSDCNAPDDLPELLHPDDYGRVNPFNPCLPDIGARGCPKVVLGEYAPFDGSPNWWSLAVADRALRSWTRSPPPAGFGLPNGKIGRRVLRVSLIMPAYNAAGHIGRPWVRGRATYGDWEVIVIDDCSTDRGRRRPAGHSDRVQVMRSPRNLGLRGR